MTALSAKIYGLPHYATRQRWAHTAPLMLHRSQLQPSKHSTQSRQASTLAYAQQAPKHVTTLQYSPTAPLSSKLPPPLHDEELEVLAAFYRGLDGPNWHIKDTWMSNSNPCGGSGAISDTWYGIECSTFEFALGKNSSSYVTRLTLPQNNLVGKLPLVYNLQNLRYLDLSNPGPPAVSTSFDNSIIGNLDALCGLGNLSTILLVDNNIIGSIPGCIESLANATVLDLDHNAIQGTTPESLCRLQSHEELHLKGSQLHGTVPACFGEAFTALRVLDYTNLNSDYSVGSQTLSGTLPTSLCDLEHLEVLYFQATQGLRGTIPDCLGTKQPQLRSLGLNTNRFYGMLPSSLCQASALEYLNLWGNALTGTLPCCLGGLSQLFDMELSVNRFHGPIPEELCQASALEYLHMGFATPTNRHSMPTIAETRTIFFLQSLS